MNDGIFLNLIQWGVDDYLPKKVSPAQKKKIQNINISTVIILIFVIKRILAQAIVNKKNSGTTQSWEKTFMPQKFGSS